MPTYAKQSKPAAKVQPARAPVRRPATPAPFGPVQRKLVIGPARDRFEAEADRVADHVLRTAGGQAARPTISALSQPALRRQPIEEEEEMLQPSVQRQLLEEEEALQPMVQRQAEEEEEEEALQASLQRQVQEDEEEEHKLQRSPSEEDGAGQCACGRGDRPAGQEDPTQRVDLQREAAPPPAAARAPGPSLGGEIVAARPFGRRLPAAERSWLEPRFGVAFDSVRVHTDARADRLTRSVAARAFTVGSDIFFRRGEYDPDSAAGQRLLAHELTHTVQQGAARAGAPDAVVQRTVTNLAVAGAVAEAGQADHFVVARRGGPVTVTAATSAANQAVSWTGGRPQRGNPLQRVVPDGRARTITVTADTPANPGPRSVTVHVVNGTAAPANTPADLGFSRQRGNPPGLRPFGLTDITTNNPTATIRAFVTGNQWSFQVQRIRHRFLLGVTSGGNRNIPNAAAGAGANHCQVIADLTPPAPGTPSGPPRANFWSRRITTLHEEAHVARFYSDPFWPTFMRTAEATIEGAASNVNVDHTVANTLSARAVVRANAAAHQAVLDAQHAAADAAEIAGAEVFAHGQSNPMYTTLIAQIAARARPLAPSALAAAPLGPASVQLNWTNNACNETEFRIFRREGRRAFSQVATVPAGTVAFNDTTAGLRTATTYTYFVRAAGVAGQSGRSNRVNVTTP